MTALYRSGSQADALEVYTRTRTVLDETLGLEPSTSLRSLHERVLRQDPSLGARRRQLRSSRQRRSWRPPANAADGVAQAPGTLTRYHQAADRPRRPARLLGAPCSPTSGWCPSSDRAAPGRPLSHLAAAADAAPDSPTARSVCGLAPVSDPSQVPVAFADALGVPLDGGAADRDIQDRLTRFLASRNMLLLVDNCEHVVDAAASVIEDILARCPDVTVITTSREALAVPDELQVLGRPARDRPGTRQPGPVLTYPASQLFVERRTHGAPRTASSTTRTLKPSGASRRALDGLPLAIELAAARMASMSPTEISERLDHRFALLTGGSRTAETRQQTLRATVDWSYALLEPREQAVFDRTVRLPRRLDPGGGRSRVQRRGHGLRRRPRHPRPAGRTVPGGRRPRPHYPVPDAGDAARVRRRAAAGRARTTTRSATSRGLLPPVRPGRRDGPARSRPTRGASAPTGRATQHPRRAGLAQLTRRRPRRRAHHGRRPRPVLAPRAATSRAAKPSPGSSQPGTRQPEAQARALQAVSIVERPRACLVHPSPRCAETAEREPGPLRRRSATLSRAALSRVLLAVEGVTGAQPERSEQLLRRRRTSSSPTTTRGVRPSSGSSAWRPRSRPAHQDVAIPTGRAAAAAFRELDDPWGLSAILYHLGWGLRQFGRYPEARTHPRGSHRRGHRRRPVQHGPVGARRPGRDAPAPRAPGPGPRHVRPRQRRLRAHRRRRRHRPRRPTATR